MTTLRVKAVSGRMLPDLQRKNAFVGYVEVTAGEQADHEIPGGRRYRIVAEGFDVQDSSYHRRAIQRGDLERVDAKPADAGVRRQKREE